MRNDLDLRSFRREGLLSDAVEFRCNDEDKEVMKFEPNPVCKQSFSTN
jgi:hypothetical protein